MAQGARSARSRWPAAGIVLACVGWVGLSRAAAGATFEDLYTVTVAADPAAVDLRAARDAAEPEAMATLLTRVTGRRDAAQDPALADLIADPAGFVISFGRLNREQVQVGFDRNAIEAELTALDWPIWGAERPLTLVWIAVDRGSGERGVLSSSAIDDTYSREMTELLERIQEELFAAADARGLPITLPLWDLVDISAISFAELWGGFDLQIAEASRRYGADAVLVGRIQLTPFGSRAQWTLLRDRERRVFVSGGVANGIDWVADQFAAEFASVGGTRNARITISGIRSLADYGRVMRFLDSVSVLESVDVEAFEDAMLTLRVAARGDRSVLERVLTLGEVLAPVPPTFGNTLPENALAFQIAR